MKITLLKLMAGLAFFLSQRQLLAQDLLTLHRSDKGIETNHMVESPGYGLLIVGKSYITPTTTLSCQQGYVALIDPNGQSVWSNYLLPIQSIPNTQWRIRSSIDKILRAEPAPTDKNQSPETDVTAYQTYVVSGSVDFVSNSSITNTDLGCTSTRQQSRVFVAKIGVNSSGMIVHWFTIVENSGISNSQEYFRDVIYRPAHNNNVISVLGLGFNGDGPETFLSGVDYNSGIITYRHKISTSAGSSNYFIGDALNYITQTGTSYPTIYKNSHVVVGGGLLLSQSSYKQTIAIINLDSLASGLNPYAFYSQFPSAQSPGLSAAGSAMMDGGINAIEPFFLPPTNNSRFYVMGYNWGEFELANLARRGPSFGTLFEINVVISAGVPTVTATNYTRHRLSTSTVIPNYDDELNYSRLYRDPYLNQIKLLGSRRPGLPTTGSTQNFPLRNSSDFMDVALSNGAFSTPRSLRLNPEICFNWYPTGHTTFRNMVTAFEYEYPFYITGNFKYTEQFNFPYSTVGIKIFPYIVEPSQINTFCLLDQPMESSAVPISLLAKHGNFTLQLTKIRFNQYQIQGFETFTESPCQTFTNRNLSHTALHPITSFEEPRISVFPNPANANDVVKIELENFTCNAQLEVISMDGKVKIDKILSNQELKEKRVLMNTTDLPAGIYLIKIKHNGNSLTQKLILSK